MIKIIADLHTHTVASGHAKGTLQEMMQKAKSLGHSAIAITDHSIAMSGAKHPWNFHNFSDIPNIQPDGFILLKGIEANIVYPDGSLDLSSQDLSRFNWVIASLHSSCFFWPMNAEQCTDIWLAVAQNPVVHMIGHPETKEFMFDYERAVPEFTKHNKVVEMNAGSALSRPNNEHNLKNLALICKKHNTKIAVTTDAHTTEEMGQEQAVIQMLQQINYPQELIINSSTENLLNHLNSKGETLYY